MSTTIEETPTTPATPSGDTGSRAHRKVRNYLIDTPLQLKLASYLLGVAVLLSAGLGWLLWQAYQETSRAIALSAPLVGQALAGELASEDRGRILLVAAALGGVLVCLLGAAVVITHRIAGPAFAIGRTCRQVGEGRLIRPRALRTGDLLVELGEDVAQMVELLRARETSERDAVLAAARTLRDAGTGAEARAAAADALEQVARDKEARLAE